MGRRSKIDKSERVEIQLPGSIYLKVKAELYSEIEGKVPFGSMSELATRLFSEWLRERGVML